MDQITLVGFMGAGKTTIGKLIAKELGLDFVDLDDALVKKIKRSVADYFAEFGEAAFRKVESEMLVDLASRPGVLATGGGIVLKEANRTVLNKAPWVIYLAVDPLVSLERIQADQGAIRPLAKEKSVAELTELLASRQALYEEVADVTINTSELTDVEVLAKILKIRQAFK